MSTTSTKWQPWLSLFQTLGGSSDPTQVIQAKENWLDTDECELAIVTTEILYFTQGVTGGVSLCVESCDDTGGDWRILTSYSAATFANAVFRKDVPGGVSTKLHRWLRWRIENEELNTWKLTFRFHVATKDLD